VSCAGSKPRPPPPGKLLSNVSFSRIFEESKSSLSFSSYEGKPSFLIHFISSEELSHPPSLSFLRGEEIL